MRKILGLLSVCVVGGVVTASLNACGHDCYYTETCAPPPGWDDASDGDLADVSKPPSDAAQDVDASVPDSSPDGDAIADVTTADVVDGFACPPTGTPKDQSCVLDEKYGVFVSPTGDDSAAGTRAAPLKTWGAALDKAKTATKSNVFACGGSYDQPLDVGAARDGMRVYGGLRCTDWTYDATAIATIAPTVAGTALIVHGLTTGVTFVDVGFIALDGTNAGDSSIAVLVAQSQGVTFERVSMTAGKGQPGLPGGTSSNFSGTTAQDGSAPTGVTGGVGGASSCSNGNVSTGGAGGSVVAGVAQNGTSGSANPQPTTSAGRDGAPGSGGTTACGTNPAYPGADGAASSAASGATRWGTLNATTWTSERGHDGSAGNPGQGGGGGGAKATPATGGGGGGAGGCGGAGGGGGGGGGSSFALLSYQAFVMIKASTLTAGDAGKGGDGAAGQAGQGGGGAALAACGGNYGGNGAGGTAGGGGAGGVSVAAGFVGNAPTLDAATSTGAKTGAAGTGGNAVTVAAAGGANALGTGTAGAVSTGGKAGQASSTLDLQ